MIAILPNFQRQGIGTDIMQSLKTIAQQNQTTLKLDVHYKNTIAIDFYNKQGFNYTGKVVTSNGVVKLIFEYL